MWQKELVELLFVVGFGFTSLAVPVEKGVEQGEVQDGLAGELDSLPHVERRTAEEVRPEVQDGLQKPIYGYDKAALMFVKRYVDALYKRTDHVANSPHKKSIYGPGMYPFYGTYGKRFDDNPNVGYSPEVMDMIWDLVQRTEAEKEARKLQAQDKTDTQATQDHKDKLDSQEIKEKAAAETKEVEVSPMPDNREADQSARIKVYSGAVKPDELSSQEKAERELETIDDLAVHHNA